VTSSRTLVVDYHKQWDEESQLEVAFDVVAPEEAPFIGSVEVGENVVDEE